MLLAGYGSDLFIWDEGCLYACATGFLLMPLIGFSALGFVAGAREGIAFGLGRLAVEPMGCLEFEGKPILR